MISEGPMTQQATTTIGYRIKREREHMKRIVSILTGAFLALSIASIAVAAPPSTGKNAIACFGDPASCQIVNKTTARLNTTQGASGGVYIPGFNSSFYGVRTSLVTVLSNTVSGSVLGIAPYWSIPIDDVTLNLDPDGDGRSGPGYTDYFLFAVLRDCNNGAGFVDVINDSTCLLWNSRGGAPYTSWAAFVQDHGNTTNIALNDFHASITADGSGDPGVWTISNMKVGKPGK